MEDNSVRVKYDYYIIQQKENRIIISKKNLSSLRLMIKLKQFQLIYDIETLYINFFFFKNKIVKLEAG